MPTMAASEQRSLFCRSRYHIPWRCGVAYTSPMAGAEHPKEAEEELLRLVLDFQNENLVARRVDEVSK